MRKIYAYCMLNGVIYTKKDIHTTAGTFTESTMVTTPDHGHVRKLINAALAGSVYKGEGKHSVFPAKIHSPGQKITHTDEIYTAFAAYCMISHNLKIRADESSTFS